MSDITQLNTQELLDELYTRIIFNNVDDRRVRSIRLVATQVGDVFSTEAELYFSAETKRDFGLRVQFASAPPVNYTQMSQLRPKPGTYILAADANGFVKTLVYGYGTGAEEDGIEAWAPVPVYIPPLRSKI